MQINPSDTSVLRSLAGQVAEIASLPDQQETIENWKRLNSLKKVKPLIYVWEDQVPWHEFDASQELDLLTSSPLAREIETRLRRKIFMWNHMRGDRVVDPVFASPLVVKDSGFGIKVQEDIAVTDANNEIVGHRYIPQIRDEKDVEKIQNPVVSLDEAASEARYQFYCELFAGILPVEKRGFTHLNCAPVDDLFTWWGMEEAMSDLIDRPGLFHQAMERLTEAMIARHKQYETLNLLSYSGGYGSNGQGGLSFSDEIPRPGFNPLHLRLSDMWGSAQAQIFAAVSPRMHAQFAVQYEARILSQFGLVYYGCCEPLHKKIEILKAIPNLRKISMSPWVDIEQAASNIGDRYVFSRKPNPAMFAQGYWDLAEARKEFREFLEHTRGCIVEVIVKDVSTVQYQPNRLFEWLKMAEEETSRFS